MTLAVKCPASMATEPGDVLVDQHDETGNISTAIHRAISCTLQGEAVPAFEGDDGAESEELVDRGVVWFNENILAFGGEEGNAQFETRLESGFISGTLDVLHRVPKRSVIADWKNTYRDDDHEPQLITYAWLEFQERPEIEEVEIFTVYLRLKFVDHKILSRAWVEAWMREFITNNVNHRDIYRPGEHCGRCPRYAVCQALTILNRRTMAELVESHSGEYLNRNNGAELWARVRLLEASIKHFRDYMKESVRREGPIELPNGKQLRVLVGKKDTILPLVAWPILEAKFTEGELANIIKIPKGELEEAIGSKAAKGKKAEDQRAFMQTLRAAGAVVTERTEKVMELSAKEISNG